MTYGWMDENFIRMIRSKKGENGNCNEMRMGASKIKREIKLLSRDYYFSACLVFYVRVLYLPTPMVITAIAQERKSKSIRKEKKEREVGRV